MISPLGNQNKKLLVVIIMLYCYLFKLLSSLVNKSFHSLSYFYYHCCLGVRNANSTLYFFIIDSIFFFLNYKYLVGHISYLMSFSLEKINQ